MGIEKFFNSIKDEFNIINSFNSNSNIILDIEYLFIDFNSIIHVIGKKLIDTINLSLLNDIKSFYNKSNNKISLEYLKLLNLNNYFNVSTADSEDYIINKYNNYFNDNMLDKLVIDNIENYLLSFLKKLNKKKLKLIYISIDGVPSKAKIIEQKKRRFIGEFESNFKKILSEKYKNKLNQDKFNKYNYLKNMINWSKSNISPGTSFMIKLSQFLNSILFKEKINKIFENLKQKDIIISDHNFYDEGEKKIIDYINNIDNKVNGNIYIYSPDADLILLSIILKNVNIKKYIIRYDQQKSIAFNDNYYDIIDVSILEIKLFNYIDYNLINKINILNDIVLIFTFFGDDFLPKIESINVKLDIKLILDTYKKILKNNNNYLLFIKDDGLYHINYNFFFKLIELFSLEEDNLLKRNYYSNKYKNYNYLIDEINKVSKNKIDHTNINEFIKKYNSGEIKLNEFKIKYLKLLEFSNSINDNKYKNQIQNLNIYERQIFKFENMLDEYIFLLNKKDNIHLGDPKYDLKSSKKKYYDIYFKNLNINNVVEIYLDGIQWIIDYYFNDITYHNWYYPFNKTPLINEIFNYLKNNNLKEIFNKSINKLKNNYIINLENQLTPLQHFFYTTPFNKNYNQLKYIRNYPNKIIEDSKKFLDFVRYNDKLKDLYPNIFKIAENISNNKQTNEINCTNAHYLNKCILNVVNYSNSIDIILFKENFNKYITINDKNDNIIISDMKRYIKKKENLKKRYLMYGKIKYKKEYKRLKHFFID